MLDQYKNDLHQQDHNEFEDTKINKKKIALALSGATFALVFFLFLMGFFRSEEAPKINRIKSNNTIDVSVLEEKVTDLHRRLDRIEQAHAQIGQPALVAQTEAMQYESNQRDEKQDDSNARSLTPSITPQGAIALTNQAVLNLIARNASSNWVVAAADDTTDIPQPQSTPAAPVSGTANTPRTAPTPAKPVIPAAPKADSSTSAINTPSDKPVSYVVRKGDTLSKISKKFYGTPNRWQAIYEANRNHIPNMNNLRVGTVLIIPPQ